MKRVILVGGGGHCKVVIDALRLDKKFAIVGIVDKKEKIESKVFGVPIIGEDTCLPMYLKNGVRYCFVAVGSIGSMDLRIKLFNSAKRIGFIFPLVVHPSAVISNYAEIGEGSFIGARAIVNPGAKIGNNCIINSGAIIEHDCIIDNHVHIAPGVVMSGGVHIKEASHIGTGSTLKHGVTVGRNTVVGIGSVVVDDIADNIVACGNPCRRIRK